MSKPDTLATDWDAYYQSTAGMASFTRPITCVKISKILAQHFAKKSFSICELGGANSCIAQHLTEYHDITDYHIIDNNAIGLKRLEEFDLDAQLTWDLEDIFNSIPSRKFDCVMSIGLIEHFNVQETKRAIKIHFDHCRPSGAVLITFPTPTLLYRLIRWIAEVVGKWRFHDERPLQFSEVTEAVESYGEILHQSINWKIGLTQGVILVRKHAI